MKKRIYTIIEVKERELLGKSLFAVRMANAGYSVVIGKKSRLYRYAKYFQTGVYYFKGMGTHNIKPMRDVKNLGHKAVGYDEEGLVMNMVPAIPIRINKECMEMVDYFFTVGQKQSNNTLVVYPKFKDKIYAIGNPRFDILKKDVRKFYFEEAERVKEKYGKFIFLASKFTKLNNVWIKGIPKDVPNNIGKTVLVEDFSDQKKIEKKLIKFLKTVPKKYPETKFVVRPHPVEDENYWKKLLKKINSKNLVLGDKKFSTNSYILASEFNIGSNCHTSLESFLCNKPTINIRADKKDSIIISEVIRAVSSEEVLEITELDKLIKSWFTKKKKFSNKLTKKNKNILNFNIRNINKDSTFFMKQKIDLINLNYINKSDRYSNFFCFKIFEILNKIRNKINNVKLSNSEKRYRMQKFSGLDLDELSHKISKICSLLKLKRSNFRVKEIYPGCFSIDKV